MNVIINSNKLDSLAMGVYRVTGEEPPLTLDEMTEALQNAEIGGGGITPTGNINITQAGETDVTNYATATVAEMNLWEGYLQRNSYETIDGQRRWRPMVGIEAFVSGWLAAGMYAEKDTFPAVAANTTVNPSTSPQTIGGANYMMEGPVTVAAMPAGTEGTPTATKGAVSNNSVTVTPSVTNSAGYISGGTKTGTAVTVQASELVSGTLTVDSSGTKNVTNYASASVPAGTAGTPSASKGTVSNHSISVTPSVTNQTGWITGSTKTGTAVTVTAAELVSGSQTVTQNGTINCTNLAEIVVAVAGGGGMSVATATATPSTASSSIQFTGLSGEPTSFVVISAADLATGASPYKTAAVVFDGTDLHGQIVTNTSNANASYSTSFTKAYSNGTLTITGSGTNFQPNQYKLIYTYGGTSANLGTVETQVGSGATSVAFTGLTGEPDYFSVIFKSNFSTSSGYQRVISMVYDGTNTYGLAMDSGAKALSSWSYTYNNGTLTVSSVSTSNGGYFHQPGYYQLTYGVGGTVEPVEIEVEPLSVTENGTYTAPEGKAYSPVTVNVSGGGGVGTLINTTSLGTLSTSSTSAASTNKTLSVTGYNDYDLLIVDISVNSAVNNRHTSTVSLIILTGTSNVTTKNTYTVGSNKWNSRLSSNGTASTRQSTTSYGIYANSASVSGSTMSIPIYYRYNSNNTGTINGNYTARVYGIKLIDLIGG